MEVLTSPVAGEFHDLDPEEAKAHAWRLQQLARVCGPGNEEAAIFLEAAGADWHQVERILGRGASVVQVLRIFAPV